MANVEPLVFHLLKRRSAEALEELMYLLEIGLYGYDLREHLIKLQKRVCPSDSRWDGLFGDALERHREFAAPLAPAAEKIIALRARCQERRVARQVEIEQERA